MPPVPPVLDFIRAEAGIDEREAYGTLNMGAGFALFVAAADAARCVQVAADCGVPAWNAGTVERRRQTGRYRTAGSGVLGRRPARARLSTFTS